MKRKTKIGLSSFILKGNTKIKTQIGTIKNKKLKLKLKLNLNFELLKIIRNKAFMRKDKTESNTFMLN